MTNGLNPSPLSKGRLWLGVLITLILLLTLLIAYYWVHKPIDLALIQRLGATFLDGLTIIALFLFAGGFGRAFTSRLLKIDTSKLTRSQHLTIDITLGLGLISVVVLLLGLVGVFRGSVFWGVMLLTTLITFRHGREHLRTWRGFVTHLRIDTRWHAFLALIVVTFLSTAFFTAAAPPATWDALTYHLVGVRDALNTGQISAHPENFYLGLTEWVEMLYGVVMSAFHSETAPALLHFGLGIVGMMGTAGTARRYGGTTASWVSLALLVSAYSFVRLFGMAYVDLGSFAVGVFFLIALLEWAETKSVRWLVTLGIAVGFAASVKYTSGAVGLVAIVFVFAQQPTKIIRNSLVLILTALIVFTPFALKGLILYQNPVYPFFIGGLNWDAGRMALFSMSHNAILSSDHLWHLPILPLSATIFGVDRGDVYDFTSGMWLFTAWLLIPLTWVLLTKEEQRFAKRGLFLILLFTLMWIGIAVFSALGTQVRLFITAFPIFAILGGMGFSGLARWPEKPIHLYFMVRTVFIFTLLLTGLDLVLEQTRSQTLHYFLGRMTKTEYLYEQTGAYIYMQEALSELPEGSQVQFMWEPRTYYCPPHITCTGDLLFDVWSRPLVNGTSPEMAMQMLQTEYDYLLVFHTGYDTYLDITQRPEEDALFLSFLDVYWEQTWTDGLRYTLYQPRELPD